MTDQELLERYYADRNNEWLGILLQRYTLLLLGVCMKYLKNEEEARDCVQQIFVKVITELPKYKVDYFKSWIYTIARNHCLMKLRDRHGTSSRVLRYHAGRLGRRSGESRRTGKRNNCWNGWSKSLEELGKEQKLCVTLFYLEKRSYQEIARDHGIYPDAGEELYPERENGTCG